MHELPSDHWMSSISVMLVSKVTVQLFFSLFAVDLHIMWFFVVALVDALLNCMFLACMSYHLQWLHAIFVIGLHVISVTVIAWLKSIHVGLHAICSTLKFCLFKSPHIQHAESHQKPSYSWVSLAYSLLPQVTLPHAVLLPAHVKL